MSRNKIAKFRKAINFCLLAGITFLLCRLTYVTLIRTPGPHSVIANNIDNLIQTEVPFGSNRSQIEKWLKSKGVTNANYAYEKLTGNPIPSSDATRSKYKLSQLSGIIKVRLDTGSGLLSSYYTFVVFFFDRQGRFMDYFAEQRAIGL